MDSISAASFILGEMIMGKSLAETYAGTGFLKISDGVRITTDAEEMEELYYRAKSSADEEMKMELLKKALHRNGLRKI